eukprot:scaffold9735_cov106-Cylindrotheca_fusiformis.AAC.2
MESYVYAVLHVSRYTVLYLSYCLSKDLEFGGSNMITRKDVQRSITGATRHQESKRQQAPLISDTDPS